MPCRASPAAYAETIAAAREYHARGSNAARGAEIWAMRLREMLRERVLDRFPAADFAAAKIAIFIASIVAAIIGTSILLPKIADQNAVAGDSLPGRNA